MISPTSPSRRVILIASAVALSSRGSPPGQVAGQLLSAYPTALMISVMSTTSPLGMPWGQADALAVPRSMFTNTMISLTVTSPLPSQSPPHGLPVGVAVVGGGEVGVVDGGLVREGVGVETGGVALTLGRQPERDCDVVPRAERNGTPIVHTHRHGDDSTVSDPHAHAQQQAGAHRNQHERQIVRVPIVVGAVGTGQRDFDLDRSRRRRD